MLPLDSDAEWLAVDLGGSRQFQLSRIDTARYLHACLPKTLAAMRAGDWGVYEAGRMVRAAQSLTRPELIDRLEDRIVPRGTRDLARRLRRAVARLDPAAVDEKTRRARTGRRLEFFKDRHGDGTGQLAGTAPSSLMALIAAAIDLDARPRLDGDCRTIDMRRLDVLADWARQRLGLPTENHHPEATDPRSTRKPPKQPRRRFSPTPTTTSQQMRPMLRPVWPPRTATLPPPPTSLSRVAAVDSHPLEGTSDAWRAGERHPSPVGSARLHRAKRCTSCGRTGPPRIPVSVTVSLDTLLSLSNEPAELTGWGLLDPDTARELAADAEWTRWVCDPTTGHLLDVGATTYRPECRPRPPCPSPRPDLPLAQLPPTRRPLRPRPHRALRRRWPHHARQPLRPLPAPSPHQARDRRRLLAAPGQRHQVEGPERAHPRPPRRPPPSRHRLERLDPTPTTHPSPTRPRLPNHRNPTSARSDERRCGARERW